MMDTDKYKFTKMLRRVGSGRLLKTALDMNKSMSVATRDELDSDNWDDMRRREMEATTAACAHVSVNHPKAPFPQILDADRSKVPRMPWHDVSLQIKGPAVRQILKIFHRRWRNARVHVPNRDPDSNSFKSVFSMLPKA